MGNLKILARLLNVSVDQLLDESKTVDGPVLREAYQLADYGYGCKKVKKDRVVRSKFPDAAIWPLLAQQEPGELRHIAHSGPDCRTNPLDRVKNTDKAFYLVEKDGRQLVVTVTDAYVQTQPLEPSVRGSSFRFQGWSLIKCNYEIEK